MGSLPNFLNVGFKGSQTLNPKFVCGATSVKGCVLLTLTWVLRLVFLVGKGRAQTNFPLQGTDILPCTSLHW